MENLELVKEKILSIKDDLNHEFLVEKIGIFGSYARNENSEESDIDILVNLKEPLGWKYFDLLYFLEDNLKRKVDLVTEPSIKSEIKDQVLKEVIYL